jgi:hypothetical protein
VKQFNFALKVVQMIFFLKVESEGRFIYISIVLTLNFRFRGTPRGYEKTQLKHLLLYPGIKKRSHFINYRETVAWYWIFYNITALHLYTLKFVNVQMCLI